MTATSCWVTETRNKDKKSLGTDHLISKFESVVDTYLVHVTLSNKGYQLSSLSQKVGV